MPEGLLCRFPVPRRQGFDPGIPVLLDLFHPLSAAGQKKYEDQQREYAPEPARIPPSGILSASAPVFLIYTVHLSLSRLVIVSQRIPVLPKPPRSFPARRSVSTKENAGWCSIMRNWQIRSFTWISVSRTA